MRTGSLEDAFRSLEADVSTVVRELGELKDKHTVLSATVQDWKEAASLPKGFHPFTVMYRACAV